MFLLLALTLVLARPAYGFTLPLTLKSGFWMTPFYFGSPSPSHPSLFLVDTGSPISLVLASRYTPLHAEDLHASSVLTFGGVHPDGSGTEKMEVRFFADSSALGVDAPFGLLTQAGGLEADGLLGLGTVWGGEGQHTLWSHLCKDGQACSFDVTLPSIAKGGDGAVVSPATSSGGVTLPLLRIGGSYTANGTSVRLALAGEPLSAPSFQATRATFDLGTTSIVGPPAAVHEYLTLAGIHTHTDSTGIVRGSYHCEAAPSLALVLAGTAFPLDSIMKIGSKGKPRCEAPLVGDPSIPQGTWIIGNVFFRGRTIRHDLTSATIAVVQNS